MKILGLAGLYLFYREFTKGGVSPITVVPPSSPNNFGIPETLTPESEADRIAKQKRLDEERKKQEEAERQKRLDEEKKLSDLRFRQDQERIRVNPPNCGFGKTAQLFGAGTREFPYGWKCILTGF